MEFISYVAEKLSAQKQEQINQEAHLALLANTDSGCPAKRRGFAFTLLNIEVTVRTVRKSG